MYTKVQRILLSTGNYVFGNRTRPPGETGKSENNDDLNIHLDSIYLSYEHKCIAHLHQFGTEHLSKLCIQTGAVILYWFGY